MGGYLDWCDTCIDAGPDLIPHLPPVPVETRAIPSICSSALFVAGYGLHLASTWPPPQPDFSLRFWDFLSWLAHQCACSDVMNVKAFRNTTPMQDKQSAIFLALPRITQ